MRIPRGFPNPDADVVCDKFRLWSSCAGTEIFVKKQFPVAMSFSASASRTMPRDYEDEFTFQPKLNARSVAMEQARVDRGEVTGRDRGEYLHNKASPSLTEPERSTATQ